ncbi:CueP family metal-binding protein [Leucobacter luti]|nr:CueP family metal-binding protein [Leucobacter luti]MBL3698734.1 hypothetical protein [Leucobacter luti]
MGISRARLRPAILAPALAAVLILAGCATASPVAEEAPRAAGSVTETHEILAGLGLDASDPVALAEGLDALPVAERPAELTASIMPSEVRVQPDQPGELVVPIAADQFYLSVAPYRTETHPCTFHVPTSCLGELRDVAAQLLVTDAATGDVVVDRAVHTADNGFVGVWLPRGGEFTVTMTVDGDAGTQTVRTGADDPTCLTTLQLRAAAA